MARFTIRNGQWRDCPFRPLVEALITEVAAILAPLLAAAARHRLTAPCLARHLHDLRLRAVTLAEPPAAC